MRTMRFTFLAVVALTLSSCASPQPAPPPFEEQASTERRLARTYVLENERALWARFSAEMHGSATGDWMWSAPANPEQPADVGYEIGARIAQTLYEGSDDKQAAARALMTVTDYPALLRDSGYPNER